MAKEHKIIQASTGKNVTGKTQAVSHAVASGGNATGLRVGAFVLWIFALAFEVLAIALILEKLLILPKIEPLYKGIGALVLDMACVIIGSQFWKKANHIDPASQKMRSSSGFGTTWALLWRLLRSFRSSLSFLRTKMQTRRQRQWELL